MKFVADAKIPFLKGVLESAGADVAYIDGAKIARADLMDAEGLVVRTRTECNAALLDGTKVKFIATATIGFDHVDTAYCAKKGIFWTNAPGCNSSSVAQYICSALMNWAVPQGKSLENLKIGIVGVGNVGSKVAKVAEALGMKTLLNDPPREREWEKRRNGESGVNPFVPLDRIKEEADIISLHVPLEDEGVDRTFHLADVNFFRGIRRVPLFINSSRGEVVDTDALKNAIKKGLVSDAVIDVWEDEPEIDLELLSLAKFATPHIAGYSTDGKANGTAMSVRAASRFFKLGLDDWFPKVIPLPERISGRPGGDGLSALADAVNFSYDIRKDDAALRMSPGDFEVLRGAYPLRREFPAFRIEADRLDARTRTQLEGLGFKI